MGLEPADACLAVVGDECVPDTPVESSGDAVAGAAAMAQPIANATVQPAIRPALAAVARVVGTAISRFESRSLVRGSISTSASLMGRLGRAVCRVAKVSHEDRRNWDDRYRIRTPTRSEDVRLPEPFTSHADRFPAAGTALELACGAGAVSVWLAGRGLNVRGLDISDVAIGEARKLAQDNEVGHRCQFDVVDLDAGLPAGVHADVICCFLFRDRGLYRSIIDRLAPGGLLAMSVLSEVGAQPSRHRAGPGELTDAFAELDRIAAGEGGGRAWLLASKIAAE